MDAQKSNWTPIKPLYTYGGVKYWSMQCVCGNVQDVAWSNHLKTKRCKKCPKPITKGVKNA